MDAICGIVGRRDDAALNAMIAALRGRAAVDHKVFGPNFAIAASHPIGETPCIVDGSPRARNRPLTAPELHAYCVERARPAQLGLRGAYAAVVALDSGRRWWLLRDALGRRPLYYYHGNGLLAFASELKALLATGLMPKRLNLLAVDRYLTLRCVPGPESIISDIFRAQPGHVIEYHEGRLTHTRVAHFDLQPHDQPRDSAARQLRSLLHDALARTRADHVLWSGGIDCAALAALRPELRPTIVTLERGWQDEMRLAKESARQMGLALGTLPARKLTEETVYRAAKALDEPLADPTVLPTWQIFEAAAERDVEYVSGYGADELLGGYTRYNLLQKAHGAKGLVPAGLLTDLLPALPPNTFIQRGGRYLVSLHDMQESYLSLVSIFDQHERESLYTDAMKSAVYDLGGGVPAVQEHFTEGDMTRNVLSLDLSVGLPNLLLAKCDRIAAAHGLRIAHPYLDDELVEFAAGLSAKTKYGVRSKPLLRVAMRGLLPGNIRLRVQRDFRIPQGGRALRVIESVAEQTITPDRVDATGLFRWHAVEAILRAGTHNIYRRRQFWALVMFFAWYRSVMEA